MRTLSGAGDDMRMTEASVVEAQSPAPWLARELIRCIPTQVPVQVLKIRTGPLGLEIVVRIVVV